MVGCYPIFYLLQVYDVFKHVGWHQLRRICGFHHDGSDDERVATVDELCRLYIESIKLVDNYSPTEIRPNDFYIALAAQILWQMWTADVTSSDDKLFWKAVVILQAALKKSPANYHLRFLLIKFLNQAGNLWLTPLICYVTMVYSDRPSWNPCLNLAKCL